MPVVQDHVLANVSGSLQTAATILKKLHLPDIALRLRAFIDTEDRAKRVAIVTSLIGLYSEAPIALSIARHAGTAPNVHALIKMLVSDDPTNDPLKGMTRQSLAKYSSLSETVTIDTSKDLREQIPNTTFGSFLEQHVEWVQPAFAVLGIIGAACGFHKVLSVDFTATIVNDLLALSKSIFALRTNWKAATEIIDPLMSAVYSFFGATYIQPKHKNVVELSAKVDQLHREVIDVLNRSKADFFGFRMESAYSLYHKYESMMKAITILQAEEKSLFNFATRMSDIMSKICSLNDMAIDKFKAQGGKQRPTVLWVAGIPGVGKTYLTAQIADRLAAQYNTEIYSRTVSDEFWSSYQGQLICVMDDIMQLKNGRDVDEFHRYTSIEQKDVVGAGLTDKGRPFVSTFLLCSSNFMWFQEPLNIQDKVALCRRRDICVYAFNPDVLDYVDTHDGHFPEGDFFKEHPTRWFLYNPTYGHNFEKNANAQGRAKFYPDAPYVIGEVSEDQILDCLVNMERRRAEEFRQRLSKKQTLYPIPSEPIAYDVSKIFGSEPATKRNVPFDVDSNNSAHEDIVRMALTCKKVMKIPAQDRSNPILGFLRYKYEQPQASMEELSSKEEFWVAKNGNLVSHSHRSYTTIALESYVVRGHMKISPIPVYNIDEEEGNVEVWEYELPKDVAQQGNPLSSYMRDAECPALLIMGPPKTGKSFAVKRDFAEDLYYVKYEANEAYPTDKILFFDDICISVDRVKVFQRALHAFHDNNRKGFKYIVATMNNDTQVWKDLGPDDKAMIKRRCHTIVTSYTFAARAWMRLYDIDDVMVPEKFEENVSAKMYIRPGRDSGLYTLTNPFDAIPQIIRMESGALLASRTRVFKDHVPIPVPKAPEVVVVIPHDTEPDALATRILFRNHETKQLEPMSKTASAATMLAFAAVAKKLTGIDIADRSQAAAAINRRRIKNETGFNEWLIDAPSYKLYVCTVEGEIVVLEVEDRPFDYMPSEHGFFYDGTYYPYEEDYDVQFSQVIARVMQTEWVAPANFVVPEYKAFQQASQPTAVVLGAAALIDLVVELASAYVMFRQEPVKEAVATVTAEPIVKSDEIDEERARRAPATQKGADQAEVSSSSKKRPPPTRFERAQRRAGRGHSSSATDSSNDKARAPAVRFEGEDEMDDDHFTSLVRLGEPGDYAYVVIYRGQCYEWIEVSANVWSLFVKPPPASGEELHRVKKVSRRYLNNAVGQTVDLTRWPEVDFASVFSSYVVKGELRDIDRDVLCPQVQKIVDQWGTPRVLVSRLDAKDADSQGAIDEASMKVCRMLYGRQSEIIDEEGNRELSGLMIGGAEGVTCHHSRGKKMRFLDREWNIERVSGHQGADLALFRVTDADFPSQKKLLNQIITNEELNDYLATMKGRITVSLPLRAGEFGYMQMVDAQAKVRAINSINDCGNIRYAVRVEALGYTGITAGGDCGTPVVLVAPRVTRKICGIHFAGAGDISMATMLTQEIIEELHSVKESKHLSEQSAIETEPSRHLEYKELSYQDKRTGLMVVAKSPYHIHLPTTTTKYRTPLDLKSEFEPSVKSKKDPRNVERRDMLREGMARYAQKFPTGDISVEVNGMADQIGLYLAAKIVARGQTTRVLSNTESINGPPVDEYPTSKKIDGSGSAGFPHVQQNPSRTMKADYLYQAENTLWYFRDDKASQSILAEASAIFAKATQGKHIQTPWTAYSKDEPVKLKKIYDASKMKTRVFFSGDFAYQLAYRRGFYAAICRIQELHLDIPVRVGIRQLSLEWAAMTYQHLSVSDVGFASDMENWDGCIPMEFLQAVPRIFNTIYRFTDPDWSPQDDVTRAALHKNVEGALILIADEAVQLDHALASGFPGTAVENSLINWILFACCWIRLAKKHAPELATFEKFTQCVCLSVFGDDNMATVAKVAQSWFHFNSFKQTAAEFGFKVTDAAKTGEEMPNLQPIEELEFLKRSFVKSGWYYLPRLDSSSINKQLTWVAGAGRYEYNGLYWPVTPNPTVFEESIRDLWPELALHGEQKYNEYVQMILAAARGKSLALNPPTWTNAMAATEFGA